MKLLSKQETQTAKASDRKREIDEGVKLAKKVDALRELAATEQANLIKFRNGNLKKIHEEIDNAITERDVLLQEVSMLEDKKKALLAPLDAEWNQVKIQKESIEEAKSALSLKEDLFAMTENHLHEKEIALKAEEGRIGDLKLRTAEELSQAEAIKSEASVSLKLFTQRKSAIESEYEVRLAGLSVKESDLRDRETDIENARKNLELEKQEVSNEKLLLADQRAMLQRTLNQLRK